MNVTSWRAAVKSPAFALAELCIVVVSGAALLLAPQIGIWAIVAALIPWGISAFAGVVPFRRSELDWLIVLFLLTAGTGLWASYDQTVALEKFRLIVMSVFLFYAFGAQPQENLVWVSVGLFCVGVGISIYFFITHDFIANPRKIEIVNLIGRWIMFARPEFGWKAIHPNYVAGLAAMTAPFGSYLLVRTPRRARVNQFILLLGLLLILSVMVMTTSRGMWMAVMSASGIWLIWLIVRSVAIKFRPGIRAAFPSLVLIFLAVVAGLLYLGPASAGYGITELGYYGNGSRAELFARSLYLVADFPITGGGLASFPGLYSQYILVIPNYFLPNAHNLFLDVFIEQGIFGGAAFLLLYLTVIWRAAQRIAGSQPHDNGLFSWVVLFSLMIVFTHGLVDDYLYYGRGTILSVALLGMVPGQPFEMKPILSSANHVGGTGGIALASALAVLVAVIVIYQNTIRSIWYSNLGAVQMARVELSGFPTGQWAGPALAERMKDAEASLLSAVQANPANRTANHRLGLIAMLRQDFPSAEVFLSNAYRQAPRHRGILKALGYTFAWLGNWQKAKSLLTEIPEAYNELDVYVWWWQTQGRIQLAQNASTLLSGLKGP